MSDEYHEVGRLVSGQIKSLRKLSSIYCGTKLIAAVVVHDGEPWLWCAGGRSGSNALMMAEWIRTRDDLQSFLAQASSVGDLDGLARAAEAVARIDDVIAKWKVEHLPAVSPPVAVRLSARRLPEVTWQDAVACRNCRRDHLLSMTPDYALSLADLPE